MTKADTISIWVREGLGLAGVGMSAYGVSLVATPAHGLVAAGAMFYGLAIVGMIFR